MRLMAISCFSAMSILIKLASVQHVSVPELVFWRQAFAMPVIFFILWRGPGFASVRTERMPAHIRRSALGLLCMALTFGSIALLPLAEATTLGYATPIFATILSVLVYGEKVGLKRGAAVFAGFIGVIILAQPAGKHLDPFGTMLGISSALLIALVNFQIRDLSRTEAATTIVFWFTLLSTIGLLVLLPFYGTRHDLSGWLLLAGIGTMGGIAQVAMTESLRHAPVSAVVGMDYVSLLWSTLAGWFLWNQLPGASTWIGAAIIITSGLFIFWRERRLQIARTSTIGG
jgi:drug/metabolite transporter (DMT)-like permease